MTDSWQVHLPGQIGCDGPALIKAIGWTWGHVEDPAAEITRGLFRGVAS